MNRLGRALALLCGVLAAEFLPLDHPASASIEFLARCGRLPGLLAATRPYNIDTVHAALTGLDSAMLTPRERLERARALDYLSTLAQSNRTQRLHISLSVQASVDGPDSSDAFTRGTLAAAYRFGRFSMVNRVQGDLKRHSALRYDELDRTFKKGVPADMPQAYLAYSGDHFGILLGRNSVQWGPGRYGHLMLSDHQPSLNMVSASACLGFLRFTTLSAKLAPLPDPLSDWNRYLSASRLSIQITPEAYLAVNQSIVYAGVNRPFEPYYVLPSYLYYFSQFGFTNSNSSENTFLSADGEWRVRKKVNLYFEFLADDFQVDSDPVSRGVQNAIAWLLGAECTEFASVYGAGMEFIHLNSYVYKHIGGWPTHYIANPHGGVLGDALGPDAEALHLRLSRECGRHGGAELRYTLVRRGERNDILGTWDPWDRADDAIPYGTVESTHRMSLCGKLVNWKGLSAMGEAGYSLTRNPGHVQDRENSGPLFRLNLDYRFDTAFHWDFRGTLR